MQGITGINTPQAGKEVCLSPRVGFIAVASIHLSLDLFSFLYGFKKKTNLKKNCERDSNLVSKMMPSIHPQNYKFVYTSWP